MNGDPGSAIITHYLWHGAHFYPNEPCFVWNTGSSSLTLSGRSVSCEATECQQNPPWAWRAQWGSLFSIPSVSVERRQLLEVPGISRLACLRPACLSAWECLLSVTLTTSLSSLLIPHVFLSSPSCWIGIVISEYQKEISNLSFLWKKHGILQKPSSAHQHTCTGQLLIIFCWFLCVFWCFPSTFPACRSLFLYAEGNRDGFHSPFMVALLVKCLSTPITVQKLSHLAQHMQGMVN